MRDKKLKKINIAASKELQREEQGTAGPRTVTKVEPLPGQPQAQPHAVGPPRDRPPERLTSSTHGQLVPSRAEEGGGEEGERTEVTLKGPGLQSPRPQWVWGPQPVNLVQGGSNYNILRCVTGKAPSLSRQGHLPPRPRGPWGRAAGPAPPGGEPAQGSPSAWGLWLRGSQTSHAYLV